jgi:hypothetical protein
VRAAPRLAFTRMRIYVCTGPGPAAGAAVAAHAAERAELTAQRDAEAALCREAEAAAGAVSNHGRAQLTTGACSTDN